MYIKNQLILMTIKLRLDRKMKLHFKKIITALLLVFSTVIVTGCTSQTWQDTVIPSTISDSLPASVVAENSEVAKRVGITRLPLPGDATYVPFRSGNYLQAFLDMGLDARETTYGFVVFLPPSGHFDKNKTFVKSDLSSKIPLIVAEANKSYLSAHRIEVAGHADTPGSLAHNQSLSERRATEVMNDMISSGLSRQRVSTIGFGERLPLHNKNIHFNRRADIIFHNP